MAKFTNLTMHFNNTKDIVQYVFWDWLLICNKGNYLRVGREDNKTITKLLTSLGIFIIF